MSLWIKICANTSLEDAMAAADAGADAVGFVFAPSPRRITADQTAAIVAGLPAKIEKVGVFVDAALEEIVRTVEGAGLTGVQLHSNGQAAETAKLRARFGPQLRILRVVHFEAGASERAAEAAQDANVDAILIDSRTATAVGGTGQTYDWAEARRTLFQHRGTPKHLIAAGGLTPENVAEAIAMLRPWGVDVVSGVESAPGRKDAAKVRAFIENARAANK
ncbi:MAG TPA: phosphoribosylanthranilate isomerase [Terracidiphilus sp.]|nr:phosphoribosylanthranilate isomerase [Terracidiphilus sp.]